METPKKFKNILGSKKLIGIWSIL